MNALDEIGRPLKVSELKPDTVVVLAKEGRSTMASVRVIAIRPAFVHFGQFGAGQVQFLVKRTGANLDEITDGDSLSIIIYEYLGKT